MAIPISREDLSLRGLVNVGRSKKYQNIEAQEHYKFPCRQYFTEMGIALQAPGTPKGPIALTVDHTDIGKIMLCLIN